MGVYHQYLDKNISGKQLDDERKKELKRIAKLLDSNVITYAARMGVPVKLPIGIDYDDLLPWVDLLDGMKGDRVAVIIETPGGSGEVARDMVENLHERFKHVTFIIPGWAKSAGTIMAMGSHDIMMWSGSALGPIDAQISQDGKQFSADALIEGLEEIKREVEKKGKLNPAYIPILQRISPGEIQNAHNSLQFARSTVSEWLTKYKFADWKTHSSTGKPVTDEERKARGDEISMELSKQSTWFTHGRSLRVADLKKLRLKITELETRPDLLDAVRRYHVLLRMTFDTGNIYKIYETPDGLVSRRFNVAVSQPQQLAALAQQGQQIAVHLGMKCGNCGKEAVIQLDFDKGMPLQPGALRYPDSGKMPCPQCKAELNLEPARVEAEKQVGRKALTPQPKN